ncbi:MAG: hypothetical protein KAR40_06985 [Candidatus Sabulitectum sp.]|nr:hypothetical protein [Candidatus Sabulitectum sp.]
MNIWEKMLNVDRRWIFLLIGIACVVPFFNPLGLPILPSAEVMGIYDHIEGLGPDNAIIVSFDFEPGTAAENQPMSVAALRHAFARNIPVYVTSYWPLGQAMAAMAISELTDESLEDYFKYVEWEDWASIRDQGIVDRAGIEEAWTAEGNTLPENARGWVFEGRDIAFLGYLPYFHLVILGMTSSIASQFPTDVSGTPLEEMPIYQDHKSLRDIDLAVTSAGGSACVSWITYGREKIGLPIAFGVTAVMATDYYIFIQSGQIVGQMGGLRGAAEYEVLLKENGYNKGYGKAFIGMDVQNIAHLLIIFLVVLGNIAFFAGGFHKKTKLKGRR